ncbi:CPBP family intramembrane glutamic endopeptidase [Streptococcus oralis]|uniref:CPBP family intramembrane metalloprotease n=2 Tax=Streptococcus oralis TaxID=1303 RepID=A0A1X1J068_STROR|nr:type II CAAX endopeptidase family protein [Streptococcus oralis]ORO78699.1 CPBP family intramembrane metalloprotease [Streptococcus oralis subsp. dentisani]QPT02576.1 CPBP family intramembrane metalloprotease [Streptococcus oralis]CAK1608196.1 CPBP family intramembrane metalloprotease [Streptococcus oralis subsp. dentisani]
MKKLGHLGVFILLVFLSVYLPELGIMHLTKFLGWGIDGYSIFLTVEVIALLLIFIYWLKKKEMLYIFEKKSSKKSRFFYLVVGLVATYFDRQLVDAFQLQFHHLIDNKYIFQDLLSILYSNGQPAFLSTVLSFILTVVIGPILEETLDRGYFMNTFFPKSKYYLDVILSGLIFGLSHLILSHRDPISLLYYSLIGLFFALVYRSTDNLRLTILCHSFFNFLNHAKPIWIFIYNYIYYYFFR